MSVLDASYKAIATEGRIFSGSENAAQGALVLVAEDHPMNRMLLVSLLKKMGAEVLEAYDGQQAVELARKNPKTDIVFMDMQMPVMNGMDAAKALRKNGYNGVIVACTAYDTKEDFEQYADCGMNDLLAKPYKSADLKAVIEKWKSAFSKNLAPLQEFQEEEKNEGVVFDAADFEDTVSGDFDLGGQLLSSFAEQTGRLLSQVSALIQAKDYDALRRIGHTLKGSAATISARSISFHGAALNKAAHEKNDKKLDGERAVLLEELKKLNEAAGRWKKEKGIED